MSSPKRILFSANDPGGANAILPVIEMLIVRGDRCEGYLTGPARDIFARRGIPFIDAEGVPHQKIEEDIDAFSPDVFVASRSIGVTIDKYLLLMMRKRSVRSVYVLDFWSAYKESVWDARDPFYYLPDAYCVMDDLARDEMLAEGFPPETLRVTGNPHFEHFTEGITCDNEDPHEILFISQPIRSDLGALYGFDEFSALRGLIEAVDPLPEEYHICVRLHPRDELGKFDDMLSTRVTLSKAQTLEEALSGAGLIVSPFSQVLIQARAAGKSVISFQPDAQAPDPLPTNRLGLTAKASTVGELRGLLDRYAGGEPVAAQIDIEKLWPKGAADSIMKVIDLLSK